MKTRKWISALMAGFLAMCMILAGCKNAADSNSGGTSSPSAPACAHNYVFENFTWNGFNAVANLRCTINGSHTKTENADIDSVVTKNPTSTETGIRTYTATYGANTDTKTETIAVLGSDVFINFTWTGFTAVANYNTGSVPATVTSKVTKAATCEIAGTRRYTATSGVNKDTKEETIQPLGHNYQFVSFGWAADKSVVTAWHTCTRVTTHKIGYPATITSQVTKAPTITETGIKTYTATYDGRTDTKTEVLPIVTSDGLEYTLNGSYYIVSGIGTCRDTEIGIPATYNDKPVQEIADRAFMNNTTIRSVAIPDSVTKIGSGAFSYCSNVTSIKIPDSVTSIGSSAFAYCSSLTGVKIPSNMTSIAEETFRACYALGSIEIPNKVTRIEKQAFYESRLASGVTIPTSVTYIGEDAFRNCGINSIVIPDSVTYVGDNAFYGGSITDATLPTVAIPAIMVANLKTVNITSGESIDYLRFQGCRSLQTVTIGDSVKYIRERAFLKCDSLKRVVIGKGVVSIETCAFEDCTNLSVITYEGTGTEWGNITKDKYWKLDSAIKYIMCSNVTIAL